MSTKIPTRAQREQAQRAVDRMMPGAPASTRADRARFVADAIANGHRCDPDAGRTDQAYAPPRQGGLLRRLFR